MPGQTWKKIKEKEDIMKVQNGFALSLAALLLKTYSWDKIQTADDLWDGRVKNAAVSKWVKGSTSNRLDKNAKKDSSTSRESQEVIEVRVR